jgi:transcriptional antiterminator RfaH
MSTRWFAIFTHPLMELFAGQQLRQQGFEVLVPWFWRRLKPHGRVSPEPVKRAVFPCYIFSRFDPDSTRWRSINGTRGVVRLICRGEIPVPIDDTQMGAVLGMVDRHGKAEIDALPKFYVNQLLRLKDGVWAGQQGLFVGADKGLLTLSLDLLGRKVKVTVPEDQVTT